MDINSENRAKMLAEANQKIQQNVAEIITKFNRIRWKTVSFIVPMAPKPSKRPRLSGYRIYVPGAAKNAAFFNKVVLPKLKGLFIETPCKVELDIFVQTPNSFTKTQQILAEMKILRPWGSTGDIDNYAKSALDMIQPNAKRGHIGIMENDCLVIESHENKYYSKTPRYELRISFMGEIPKDILKILKLKGVDSL